MNITDDYKSSQRLVKHMSNEIQNTYTITILESVRGRVIERRITPPLNRINNMMR